MAIYVALLNWYWSFTADDAYIVYRYAENLIDGHGLVFNLGEPVSALTSPLHAFLCAALYALSGWTVLAHKVAAALMVPAAMWFAVCRSGLTERYRVLAMSFVLLCPLVILWTVGGLETPLLLSLILCVYALRPRANAPRGQIAAFSLGCGLCVLTRYDAALFVTTVAASSWIVYLVATRRLLDTIVWAVPGITVVAGWLAFSNWYFHDILPTSYYHKMPDIDPIWIYHGFRYTSQLLVLTGIVVPLADPSGFGSYVP